MNLPKTDQAFRFQQFAIYQDQCAMKVGTDGILLGAWARVTNRNKCLDIGCGTGLIALMLAQRAAEAKVIGVEIDKKAAQQAQENTANSPFSKRVNIVHAPVQKLAEQELSSFDLIVCNPPFFTGGVLSDNAARAEVRHTVKLSHQDLLRSVQQLLSPAGSFCLILPWLEGLRFQELAANYQLYPQRICKVAPRPGKSPNRLLLAFGKVPTKTEQEEMTIYAEAEGLGRSAIFKKLTEGYYLT